MKKSKILIMLLILFLIPTYAYSQNRIEFTPSISVRQLYDDNIDLDRDTENVRSDWITSISPAFDLNITGRTTNFNLGYSPSFVRYRDYDNNDTTRHAANLAWNQQLTEHLVLEMSGEQLVVVDAEGFYGEYPWSGTQTRDLSYPLEEGATAQGEGWAVVLHLGRAP